MILRLSITLAILLSLVAVVFTGPSQHNGRICGNQPTPEDMEAKERKFVSALSGAGGPMRLVESFSNYTIPVYFNVIYSGKKLEQGYIP